MARIKENLAILIIDMFSHHDLYTTCFTAYVCMLLYKGEHLRWFTRLQEASGYKSQGFIQSKLKMVYGNKYLYTVGGGGGGGGGAPTPEIRP